MKFLKSIKDLKIFYYQKLPFFLRRVMNNPVTDSDTPLSLQIEPTNNCNLRCISCSRSRSLRPIGYMDFSLFQKIIDNAAEIGIRRVHLYLHGEPMLHPRIMDMFKFIKKRGLAISMATNGMLLDEKKIHELLNSGVNSSDYITFSILGYSKAVHERIMRGVKHETVLNNVLNLIKLRGEFKVNGPIIETVFYKMNENIHESNQFKKYWEPIVDHVHPVEEISKQFSSYGTNNNQVDPREKTCRNLWERMTIFWDGNVTTCIADLDGEINLGNLKDKTIKDIWDCKELLNIKILHKQKEFEKLKLCSRCDW